MKKTAMLFLGLVSAASMSAQVQLAEPAPYTSEVAAKKAVKSPTPESVTVFWSEDFANGIPSSWSQNGTPSAALWEYRGPNTNPSNTGGSRGAFSGITTGANDPIFSSTTGNGFVIFDSDFLDNGGDPNNMGGGAAIAPHVGRLTSPVIDLSAENDVELKFEMYARRFFSDWFVAFSRDGGVTFPDTVEFFPDTEIAVNGSTDNGVEALANVSAYIGGESQAVIQFIFDGTPGNANGNGYYYWMLDDIELRTPPDHQLFFTAAGGAPKFDMILNGQPTYGKYGAVDIDQIVPIEFDANMFNYGRNTQTNARLEVEVWEVVGGSPSLVTTLTTTGCATLASGDTCDFSNLTTPQWTPPTQVADYLFVYKAVSDSIPSSAANETDTFNFSVTERGRYSLDNGTVSGFTGTNVFADPNTMDALLVQYALENQSSDPNADPGLIYIDGIQVAWSATTDSTADIEFALFDTTGFAFNAGFPASAQAVWRQFFQLNGNDVGTVATYSVATNNRPLALPANTYALVMNMFPNASGGVVRLANDETWSQPGRAAAMLRSDGNWFSGFLNSRAFNAPFLRIIMGQPFSSIDDADLNSFSVYPNPIENFGHVEFETGGAFEIEVLDMVGNRVMSKSVTVNAGERISLDFNNFSQGFYLVNVRGEGLQNTTKISVK